MLRIHETEAANNTVPEYDRIFQRLPGNPDFLQFQLSLGAIVGWTGSVTLDTYGGWHFSWLGANAGKSLTPVSASLTMGWDIDARAFGGGVSPSTLRSDLDGWGLSGPCAGFILGGCVSPNGIIQGGLFSPQVGISGSKTFYHP